MSILSKTDDRRFMLAGPFDDEMPYYYVVIADYRWWVRNEKTIYDWMDLCLPKGRMHHRGMVIVLETEADASNFLLKWQS